MTPVSEPDLSMPQKKPRRWIPIQEYRELFAMTPERCDYLIEETCELRCLKIGPRRYISLWSIRNFIRDQSNKSKRHATHS